MTNLERAEKAGWKVFKGTAPWLNSESYYASKCRGLGHNNITEGCISKEAAATAALDLDYKYHRKKECHVWLETEDPAKGGKQGRNFVKVSPPLTQETAEVVANLYRMEHPDQDFSVSIGKPTSYFL